MSTVPVPSAIGRETWQLLERAEMDRHGTGRVWSDWLDICVLAMVSLTDHVGRRIYDPFAFDGPHEDAVRAKTRPYSAGEYPNRPYDYLAKAWGAVQDETAATGEDVLGTLFMERVATHGWNGQFFTPTSVCDMMAQMTIGDDLANGAKVLDPACGSGRMLLAAAKINRTFDLHGIDVDHGCCVMTVLNLAMRGLKGHVTEGNALSMEMWREWRVHGAFIHAREIPAVERPKRIEPVVKLKPARVPPPLFALYEEKTG